MIDVIRNEVNRETKTYPSFRIMNFGRFYVPESIKNHVYNRLLKKKEEGTNESI